MRKLAVGTIAVILALGYLAAVLPVMADSPPPGATPDPLSAYETGDKQFKRYDIGDKTVYWNQRTVGDAIVEGDYIRYQFDRDSGALLTKKTEWRDGLPAQLPPIIPREQAEAGIGREILHSILYLISPDSFVHPITPVPQNPCWVVTSADDLDIYVDIIDAVTGEYLGHGVPPPYEGFAFSGPTYLTEGTMEWAEFDDFRVRNYCSPQPAWGDWSADEEEGSPPPWYNSNWGYRRQGNVTASAACGNLSGYQMELKLHYGAGNSSGGEVFLNGSSLANFSDIRFTAGDGVTLLDHWVQEHVPSTNATVWINFSAIATGGTSFYIYYDNPSASSASNGSSTFIIFNDGSSLDGWSLYPGGSSYNWSAYNGVIRCNVSAAAGGWSNLYHDNTTGTDYYVAESKVRAGAGLLPQNYQQGIGYGSSPMARWLESINKWNLRDAGGSADSAADDAFDARKWHDYSFVKNGTSWELFVDGNSKVTYNASNVSRRTGLYVFMVGNSWVGFYQNANAWFETMGYPTEDIEYPKEGQLRGHVQSDETALFYAIAHGDSMRFVSGYADITHCHEIHYWLEHYARMPFAFLGNCGAMCDMARGSTSYEFRKGSTENTTAVGYHDMSNESCAGCWAISIPWQDALFNYTNQSYTVKQAFDAANADYPVCVECTRFVGDESLKLVPKVSREAAAATPTPTTTASPQWDSMNVTTGWGLRGVWGNSPTVVFTVGELGNILHYNGSSWSSMSNEETKSLRAVWGDSPSNVFTAGTSGAIMHYNGSGWSLMETNTGAWFIALYGNSSPDLFAISDRGTILHYNGSNWSMIVDGDLERLYGAWGTSPSDVFATGVEGNIWHCNGSNWSDSGSGTAEWLTGMWGTSPSDIFAVGDHGTILHYNGSNWSAMDSGTSEWLWGVWGSSSSDVFVVGTAGTVLHYNGSTWSRMSSGTAEWLYGVWGSSPSDVFAVGNRGTILHYSGPGSTPTPTATPQPGDANGDGAIDAADITKIERIILGWDAETPGADANGDGEVNTTDIGVVEYMILGIWPWNHVHIEAPDNLPHCTRFPAAVFITYVEDFGSAGCEVSYNASVLDLENVTGGRLMQIDPGKSAQLYTVNVTDWSVPGPGAVRINASIEGVSGASGAGYLSRLHFHVNGSAGQSSPIAFNVSECWLRNALGGAINATWANDSVTVAP